MEHQPQRQPETDIETRILGLRIGDVRVSENVGRLGTPGAFMDYGGRDCSDKYTCIRHTVDGGNLAPTNIPKVLQALNPEP